MKVISTGEKIKKLRTDIGLKQDEIANDEITRSLISMIENNKRNLTFRTAQIIAKELNKYYVNLGAEITPDLLMESEVEQAQRIIREQLDEMRQLLENPAPGTEKQIYQSFQKLVDFAKEWRLYEMIANLQEARGKFYYKTYQYNKALEDFFNALEYHLKKENYMQIAILYSWIGSVHYQLELPEQALLYYDKVYVTVLSHRPSNYERMKMLVLKNKILCYQKMKMYDRAFKAIGDFKMMHKNEDEDWYDVLLMEANTYQDIHNYGKASKLYDRLLKKSDRLSPSLLLLVYESYADLYLKKGEYQESLKYIQSAAKYISEDALNNGAYIYLKKAKACWKLGKIKDANEQIEKGLVMAEKVSKIDVIIELTIVKAKIEIDSGSHRLAEKKLNWLLNYVENKNMKKKMGEIYLYFMELYCKQRDNEKCLEYIIKAQQLKEEEIFNK